MNKLLRFFALLALWAFALPGCAGSKKIHSDTKTSAVSKSEKLDAATVVRSDSTALQLVAKDSAGATTHSTETGMVDRSTFERETTIDEVADTNGKVIHRKTTIKEHGQTNTHTTIRSKDTTSARTSATNLQQHQTTNLAAAQSSRDTRSAANDTAIIVNKNKKWHAALPFEVIVFLSLLLLLLLVLAYRYIRKRFPNFKIPL